MLLVGNPFFDTRRDKIITFAAQQKLPAMYHFREYVVEGGLMSYGNSLAEAYSRGWHLCGQDFEWCEASGPAGRAIEQV